MSQSGNDAALRAIAFYLPQFHAVPENDEWWGKGFTEWRNVARARPLFSGHDQPHIPADLGFYDLRMPLARQQQAALAGQYGVGGFCYYHYWFNGRRILETPFNEVLASGEPDFPFCLCWANENWTRVWDGGEKNILLGQNYNHDDDREHIRSLIPAFRDRRYIRIDGRPLFLVYRTELLPDPAATASIWRDECRQAGIGEIYLARVENFVRGVDPQSIGFDAGVEFAPDNTSGSERLFPAGVERFLARFGILPPVFRNERVVSYRSIARAMAARPTAAYKRFRCVTPMWDNTARRGERASIYVGSTPALYEDWLRRVAGLVRGERQGEERIVFINAWNEWAEGCHLEPDQRWGRRYLEATQRALATPATAGAATAAAAGAAPALPAAAAGAASPPPAARVPPAATSVPAAPSAPRRLYWQLLESARVAKAVSRQVLFQLGVRLMSWSHRQ